MNKALRPWPVYLLIISVGGWMSIAPKPQAVTSPMVADNEKPKPADSMALWLTPAVGSSAEKQLIQLDFDWRRGGFDTVMIATFKIKNGNPFAIKDIAVVCELSAPSGTTVGLNTVTLYEIIPAKGRKTIREVNMGRPLSLDFGQAAGASCLISKFHRA